MKISAEFYPPQAYIDNDYNMNSKFQIIEFWLKPEISISQSYSIIRNTVNFKESYVYNPTLLYKNLKDWYVIADSIGIEYPR